MINHIKVILKSKERVSLDSRRSRFQRRAGSSLFSNIRLNLQSNIKWQRKSVLRLKEKEVRRVWKLSHFRWVESKQEKEGERRKLEVYIVRAPTQESIGKLIVPMYYVYHYMNTTQIRERREKGGQRGLGTEATGTGGFVVNSAPKRGARVAVVHLFPCSLVMPHSLSIALQNRHCVQ